MSASQSGRTITFTYTAATGGISNGTVTLVVPAGWTAPSLTASNPGYTTASSGTVAVAGQTITVSSLTVAGGSTFTITYGDTSSGGTGATATSSTGAQTWQAQAKSTSAGSLTNLGSSPSITVYAADGTGTLTTGTSAVSASQTGRTITFTYTAATGGISNGTVTLDVPNGWTAPSTTGSNAGYTTSTAGTVSVASQTITVSSLTLAGGATVTITYGSTAGGGSGATATSSTGAQTWQAKEKSTSGGSLTNLGSSPSITVYAADGTGTLTTPTTNVSASQTGRTITFTYTAAAGGMSNGTVTLDVPSGWSAPSTTAANAGYSTSTAGTLSVAGQTITVSSLTLAGGATATITYGSTAGGGPGATASSSTGAQTWQAQEKSIAGGSLTNLGASPSVTVNAADGSGTLTTPTATVVRGSAGNTITFTYTAAAGGISNGSVTLVVPAGWTAPSLTGSNPGYTTASTGTVAVASQTITVSSLTVAGGSTFTITYGSTAGGGSGATATSSSGAQTWQAQARSTSGGTLTNLASSPSITVLAADGSGTLTTPTGSVNSASTGNTITFTYTAATGGMSNGSVTIAVPSGWTAPSTTGSNAGYTTSSTGTVSVATQTITVSSVTLSGGATMTIVYGSTAGGGAGATAPTAAGSQTWQGQQKSSSGGSLTNLGASPSITVNDTTAPSAPSLSFGSLTNASVTGTTVYIRQGAAGGFTVTGTSNDPESGIDHLTFPGGFGAGWTGGGADSSSPYTSAYTFSAAATAPGGTQNVTSTNGWAMASLATGFTVVADTTAPSVTAPSVTAGYYTALSVPVTKNGGSDGGSGVDATTSVLERDEVGLSNGACGTFPGSWSTVTLSGGNDTSVLAGKCYRYRELLSDNVGNQGTSSASNAAKIDTSAPSTPSLAFSGLSANAFYDGAGTFWFRPSAGGTFTVTAASTDGQSDIGSYTFGTLNSNGGTNFGGSQTGDHFDYTFGATTTAPTTSRTVNSTNGAGTNSTNATYTINSDTTGPTVPAPTVSAGYFTSLSVPVSLGSVTDTGGSGPNASSFTVQRDTIGLSNGSCGTFTGSWSTITLTAGNDTGVTSGNCYRYREIASDNVGNSTTSPASNTAKIDTSAPSTPSLAFSGLSANAFYDGAGTFWFRPSAGGTFTVTAASTDGQSDIGSYTFGTLNSNGGTNFGGSQTGDHFDYTFGATTTAPTTSRTVNSTNGAGTNSTNATYTINSDTTGPTVPAPTVSAGYFTSLSVPVSLGSVTDTGGSGPNASSFTVQRDTIGLSNGSCGTFTGSWSTITLTAGNDTGVTSGNCYRYREIASDNVGNSTTSPASNTAKIDTAGPTNSITTSSVSPAGSLYKNGSTIYYRGAAAGSFKLTNAVSDAISGPASSATAALGGTTTGWTHTPSTISTPSGGPYDSNSFSWNAGTTSAPTEVVTGADNAGNTTASAAFTFTNDSTAPSVTAPTVSAGYYTTLSISVTKNGGSDAGADIDNTTSIVQRDDITLTNGTCGTFTGSWSTITLSGGNDTNVTNGNCYRYRELLSDNVGNQGTSTASNTAKVDTTAPAAPSLAFGGLSASAYYDGSGTLYFRPSAGGTFTVTATPSDAQSGIGSYTFGTLNSNGGSNFGGSQSGDHFDYTFGPSTTAPSTARTVSVANGAGTSSADATYAIAADTTAPSVTAPERHSGLRHQPFRGGDEERWLRRWLRRRRIDKHPRARRHDVGQRELQQLHRQLVDGHAQRRQRHRRGQRALLPISRAPIRPRRQPGHVCGEQHRQSRRSGAREQHLAERPSPRPDRRSRPARPSTTAARLPGRSSSRMQSATRHRARLPRRRRHSAARLRAGRTRRRPFRLLPAGLTTPTPSTGAPGRRARRRRSSRVQTEPETQPLPRPSPSRTTPPRPTGGVLTVNGGAATRRRVASRSTPARTTPRCSRRRSPGSRRRRSRARQRR